MTPAQLVVYVSWNPNKPGNDVVSSRAGSLLKEETCRFLARRSEVQEARRELRGITAQTVRGAKEVTVVDGNIEELDVQVNLADGVWAVESTDDKVELVRSIESLIEVPEADDSRVTFQLDEKYLNKLNEIEMGSELRLVKTKVEKKGFSYPVDAVTLVANGETIAEVFAGKFSKNRQNNQFLTNAGYYDGIVGNFTGVNVTKKDLGGSQFFVVTLDNVRHEEKENPEPSQTPGNGQIDEAAYDYDYDGGNFDIEEYSNMFADLDDLSNR